MVCSPSVLGETNARGTVLAEPSCSTRSDDSQPCAGPADWSVAAPTPLPVLLGHEATAVGRGPHMKIARAVVTGAAAPRPPLYMNFIAACAALNSINLGYDVGVSSGVGPLVEKQMSLTELEVGLFFGILQFVAALGALGSQGFADRYGRRMTFMLAQLVSILGIICATFAQTFTVLIIGRVLIGIGIGIGLCIDPLYIAEAAPAAHRGQLTTWSEIAINLGILLGFVANLAFENLPEGVNWRVMLAAGAVLPGLLIVLSLTVMPESPRWLVARRRLGEAEDVLRRTHHAGEDIKAVLAGIEQGILEEEVQKRVRLGKLVRPDSGARRAVLVGLGVSVAQQINGIEAVIFYSPTIFKRAGMATTQKGLLSMSVVVGLVKVFFVGLSACFIDSVGRRPLLILSTSTMAISLVLVSLGSWLSMGWLSVLGVMSFVACFSIGVGPVTWLLLAELFPLCVRAKAISLGIFLNRITSASVALTFLPLSQALRGQAGYFALFAAITAGTAVAAICLVPETKRLSLEQIGACQARKPPTWHPEIL